MSFRFVHAADLHLDSPFKGLGVVDADLGRTLQRATFAAYDNIVSLCLAERVDALIVAGDIYDGADRSLGAQLAFRDGLARLADAGIRSYVVHGNHDPLDGWRASLAFPELVHRFGPAVETVTHEHGGERVTVHGFSYPRRAVLENIAEAMRADPGAAINVGVLHATVGTQPGHDPYAPCSIADLEAAAMDYWALGHVHERQVLRASHPAVVYAGNSQGRHLREPGARGVYLVDLEHGLRPRLEFRATDVVRWERCHVDITRLSAEQELLDAILNGAARLARASEGRLVVAAVALSGTGALHDALRREGFAADLIGYANAELGRRDLRVVLTGAEDATAGENIDAGAGSFIAEVLLAAGSLEIAGGEVELALAELLDHPALRSLERPGPAAVHETLERAKVAALDALREAAP